jgi:uncharacterized protein (DUF1499 family)
VAAFTEFFIRFVIGVGITVVGSTSILAVLARVVKSPANLGVRDGKLASCPNAPNCVSTQSQDPRHQIDPVPYTTSPAEAKDALLQIIRSMERSKIITDDPTCIRAEFRSKRMRYVDYVELYLDQETSVIHFRSSARLPYYDWGVNRKRMEEIRTAFRIQAPL